MRQRTSLHIKKSIISTWIGAFVGVVLLTGSVQAFLQFYIHRQKNDGKVVNLSGRQRMLSQRLAKIALQVSQKPELKADLERVFSQLNTSHQKLQFGSESEGIPAPFSEEIVRQYEELDPILLRLRVAMDCVVANCAGLANAQTVIQTETEEFLEKMDRIVFESEQVSKEHHLKQSLIELALFILILAILLFQWLGVVKPAKKILDRQKEGLDSKESFISKMGQVGKIGYWERDLRTDESFWSPEVYEIFKVSQGTPASQIDGISFYAEHERGKIENLVKACRESLTSFDDEFEFYDNEGNHKWVRVVGEAQTNYKNEAVKLVGVFQDVTARKASQLEIEESKRYLELAVHGANLGIWDWDLRDNSVKFDLRWAEMLGIDYSKIEMKLETWESRVHPDDIKKCYKDIQDYLNGKTPFYENVHRMKHADGHWVYILDRGRLSGWDHDGKPIRFTGTHLDITESRKLQEEQKFILSSARIGIWKWNITDNILEWDDSLYDLYEVDRNQFTGAYDAWEKTLHPDYKEQAVKDLEDALAGIRDFDTIFAVKTSSGKIKYIGGRGKIERDEQGNPVFMYGINWDKTEKILYERELEHNSKLASIGQLAAGVGHEINNPLTIINGYLGFLKSEDLSSKTKLSKEDIIKRIESAVERIANIVKGLRTFARNEKSDLKEKFNLEEVIKESTDMISEIFKKEGVEVTYKNYTKEEELFVIGSRGKLQQILVNLISNAKDASEGKSTRKIDVQVSVEGKQIVLEVSDNGEGISQEDQKRIFDPFFTTKGVGKGTGLGLSIVHKLVQELDGEISLLSTKGVGSRFIIHIPKESGPNAKIESRENSHLTLVKEKTIKGKVLLVDDEVEIRNLLSRLT